jgi:hypothetical protein
VGTESQGDEPDRAGSDRADPEQPTPAFLLVGQRSEQDDGVQVDVRVQEREGGGGE